MEQTVCQQAAGELQLTYAMRLPLVEKGPPSDEFAGTLTAVQRCAAGDDCSGRQLIWSACVAFGGGLAVRRDIYMSGGLAVTQIHPPVSAQHLPEWGSRRDQPCEVSPAELPFGAIRATAGVRHRLDYNVRMLTFPPPKHDGKFSPDAPVSAAGDAFLLASSTLDALLGCATASYDVTACQRMQSPAPALVYASQDLTCPLQPASLSAVPRAAGSAGTRLAERPPQPAGLLLLAAAVLLGLNVVLAVCLLRQRTHCAVSPSVSRRLEACQSCPPMQPAQRAEPSRQVLSRMS